MSSTFSHPLPEGTELALIVVACGRQLQRDWNRLLQPSGTSESQLALLVAIAQGAKSQKEIAYRTGFSPAQISGLVEQLRQRGLVWGRRADHDRRQQRWQLTAEGCRHLKCCQQLLDRWSEQNGQTSLSAETHLRQLTDWLLRQQRGGYLAAEDEPQPEERVA